MPSIAELGQKVKAKYPGQYDDLSDQELGQRVKTKYPGSYDDFSDQAAAPTPAPVAAPAPTPPANPLADFARLTSTGGIGGMGGIEENPGMAAMSPQQRQATNLDALNANATTVGTELVGAAVPKVVGFGVNNPVTRMLGKVLLHKIPFPLRVGAQAAFEATKAGLPTVEEVGSRINPLSSIAPTAEQQLTGRVAQLERRLVKVREHLRELRPRPPKAGAEAGGQIAGRIEPAAQDAQAVARRSTTNRPMQGASTPELARRTAARAKAVGKTPPAAADDLMNQLQAMHLLTQIGKAAGQAPDEILRLMTGR